MILKILIKQRKKEPIGYPTSVCLEYALTQMSDYKTFQTTGFPSAARIHAG